MTNANVKWARKVALDAIFGEHQPDDPEQLLRDSGPWLIRPIDLARRMVAALPLPAPAPDPRDEALRIARVERVAGFLCNMDEGLEPDDPWGHNLIGPNRDAEHRGDCTREAFTCLRCLYINETKRAEKLLSALAALNAIKGGE